MSAFLLGPDDLAAIARALSAHTATGDDAAAETWFDLLLEENLKSISYRYPDASRISDWFDGGEALFTWAHIAPTEHTAEQLDDLVRSYRYQSCEHPGWADSIARKATDALRAVLRPRIKIEQAAAAAIVAERRTALAKIPALYPKETAKVIRRVLREAFRGVKFQVVTNRGSMVSSVDIRWTDGPTTQQVDELVACFKAGRFDGMDDSYTYDRDRVLSIDGVNYRPACQYVHTTRDLSPAMARRCAEQVAAHYGVTMPAIVEYVSQWTQEACWKLEADPRIPHANEYASTLLYRAANAIAG